MKSWKVSIISHQYYMAQVDSDHKGKLDYEDDMAKYCLIIKLPWWDGGNGIENDEIKT